MAEPVNILRRAGANLAHATRCLVDRAALQRGGGFWLALRLAPPLEEFSIPRFPFEGSPSLLQVLQLLDAAASDPDVDGVLLELAGAPDHHGKDRRATLFRTPDKFQDQVEPRLQPGQVFYGEFSGARRGNRVDDGQKNNGPTIGPYAAITRPYNG